MRFANNALHGSSAALLTRCFLSAGAVNVRHVVACRSAPEQKATAAERGASSGVQATFPGNRAAVMLAWTPPMLKPHMPAREHGKHALTLGGYRLTEVSRSWGKALESRTAVTGSPQAAGTHPAK